MPQLSRAQKITVLALAVIVAAYIALLVAGPVLEYLHGPSPGTLLLRNLAGVGPLLMIVAAGVVFILQRISVLPFVKIEGTENYPLQPIKRFRNLALWIVIALLLVFLFNLFQPSGGPRNHIAGSSDQSNL